MCMLVSTPNYLTLDAVMKGLILSSLLRTQTKRINNDQMSSSVDDGRMGHQKSRSEVVFFDQLVVSETGDA